MGRRNYSWLSRSIILILGLHKFSLVRLISVTINALKRKPEGAAQALDNNVDEPDRTAVVTVFASRVSDGNLDFTNIPARPNPSLTITDDDGEPGGVSSDGRGAAMARWVRGLSGRINTLRQAGAGRTAPHFSAASVVPSAFCVGFVVLATLAVVTPARAQDTTLVSNTSLSGDGGISRLSQWNFAQGFMTGSNTAGYTVTEVDIKFNSKTSTVPPTVKLIKSSPTGANPVTLQAPASMTASTDNLTLTYTAPTGTSLDASATYFVLMTHSSNTISVAPVIQRTSGDSEPVAATGWSINNLYKYQSKSPGSSFLDQTAGYAALIAVRGTVKTSPNNPATGVPTITGTAQVGQTLTAVTTDIMDADGLTSVSYTYQWIRVDGTDVYISNATASTYTLVAADQGKTIKVKVFFTDDASNPETLTSAATSMVIAAANTPATGVPTITGTAQVGQTLTAVTTAIMDADGLTSVSYTYQWIRVDGTDADIASATASTYTLVAADQGKTIKVKVSFTDDASNPETLTSAATSMVIAAANNPATGVPTITGTAQVGQTLTAVTTAIMDADGLTSVSYTYQWIRVDGTDADIASATASTYTLVAADQGKTIKVKVSFTDDASNPETLTSATTSLVIAAASTNTPATGVPTITGTAQVGQTLTAVTTAIMDADGLTSVSYTYQWIRVDGTDADIGSATASTYTLVAADQGTTIKVKVSFTDDASNPETLTSAATSLVIAAASTNNPATGVPTITGTARVGQTLTAVTTAIMDADGLTSVSYTYQWILVDGSTDTNIGSATASTYTLVAADQGTTIKVKVSFTDDASNPETLTSATTSLVIAVSSTNTPATGVPTITGTAQVGQTLTAVTTAIMDADGLTSVSYTYQWIRVDGSTVTNIGSATASTYTLVAADQGTTIKVKVSFTDDASNPETLTSAATSMDIAAANTPATGVPTITGTAQVGQTLTAVTTAIMDADGLTSVSYTYQWIRVDGTDADIASATASTYTLLAADQGKTIKVKVSFTDDASNPETLTSAATSMVIAAANNPATGVPTITGTAQVGQTLTAVTTAIMDADGLTSVSYTYQWIRVDGTDADIGSATASTYTLVAADQDTTIKVKVSFTDDASNPETLTSATTSLVIAAASTNTPATGVPTITGTAQVGKTLTAVTTAIMDADGLTSVSYTYQWIRVDGTNANIASATASTYTLVAADQGKTIKVKVSFTDDASNLEQLTSVATAAVSATTAVSATVEQTITPAAWMARFGRTVADQVLGSVEDRMSAPQTPGTEISLAGHRIGFADPYTDDTGRAGRESFGWSEVEMESRGITRREMLTGSSFTLTGDSDGGALWARGTVSDFDGRAGDLGLDGEVVSEMLGVDRTNGRFLVGVALGHSRGDGAYWAEDGDNANGEIETTLIGIYPYGRYELNDRLSLWGVAGYGTGTLTLTPEGLAPMETEMDLVMAAIGGRGALRQPLEDTGLELAVRSDALAVHTTTDTVRGSGGNLASTEEEVTRLRFGLEGTWHGSFPLGVVPTFEIGVRYDGGNAETGFGTDIGAGFTWTDPVRGIRAEFHARELVSHEDDGFRERGLSGALFWESIPDSDLGWSLGLAQTQGAQATGGMDALLNPDTTRVFGIGDTSDDDDLGQRLAADLGYGVATFGGRYTSTSALGLRLSGGSRETVLGWRLSESQNSGLMFGLDVEGRRSESSVGEPEHSFGVLMTTRW